MVRSTNISSDHKTGIGHWTKEAFVYLFHSHSDSLMLNTKLKSGNFNSIMPWTMYGKMTSDDLESIFAYLKTVAPVNNKVERFLPVKK